MLHSISDFSLLKLILTHIFHNHIDCIFIMLLKNTYLFHFRFFFYFFLKNVNVSKLFFSQLGIFTSTFEDTRADWIQAVLTGIILTRVRNSEAICSRNIQVFLGFYIFLCRFHLQLLFGVTVLWKRGPAVQTFSPCLLFNINRAKWLCITGQI